VDFGCGSGENTILLVHRQAQVIGIDISPDLIALAKRRLALNGLPNAAQFHVGSAYHLPVESNSVDVVFGIAILHHLDLEQAATEVHRVLKPGGRGIFQEPVRNSPVLRAIRGCIPYKAPDVSPFERPLRSAELASFASHFSSSFERAFSLPFVNVVQVVPMLRRFVPSAYQYDKRVLGAVPKLERYAGVRVMQVTK
jgi:SAM-dependent methyltransferase